MTIATKEISKVQKVRDLIKSYEGAMARLLPKHVSVERMTQIAMINIGKAPKLAECHAATLIGAIRESVRMDLEPGAGAGHTWLIPFFNKKTPRRSRETTPSWSLPSPVPPVGPWTSQNSSTWCDSTSPHISRVTNLQCFILTRRAVAGYRVISTV